MSGPYCYEFPRPAVTVDAVVFGLFDKPPELRVVMVRRGKPPFQGHWALPGGFLEIDEPAQAAAARELAEETGIPLESAATLHPLGFYEAPGRDPRGRTISLAYVTALTPPLPDPSGGDDAAEAHWITADPKAQPLAFDHAQILTDAPSACLLRSGFPKIGSTIG